MINKVESVYVFDFGDFVKIGVTNDILRREKQLSYALCLSVINRYHVDTDNAYSVEDRVKTALGNFHLHNEKCKTELFSCDFFTACRAVEVASKSSKEEMDVAGYIEKMHTTERSKSGSYNHLFCEVMKEAVSLDCADVVEYLDINYSKINEFELYKLLTALLREKISLYKLKDKIQLKLDLM